MKIVPCRGILSLATSGIALALWASLGPWGPAVSWGAEGKFNVLMICVDDLRPELGCYGVSTIQTPHIDRLAAGGFTFLRAYCQQAVCNPSRVSLLFGLRPDSTRIYDLQTHPRKTLAGRVSLPEHFKNHGYVTMALSKVFHNGLDDPQSWSVPHWSPSGPGYGKPETIARVRAEAERLRREQGPATEVIEKDPQTGVVLRVTPPRYRVRGPAWEDPDVPDESLPDGKTTQEAIARLEKFRGQRFFLAVGYLKPHLPFVAPRRYFALYDRSQVPLAPWPVPPRNCPAIALHDWGELRAYEGIPAKGPLPQETARDLVWAYYAATSYVDAQVGKLLDTLDRLDLADKTVVVLWGDHGWHLGDNGLWCKHSNFERATRSPLILRIPGARNAGAKISALVEFVDIYPTLCELCGLPLPQGLEGTSLLPLVENPNLPWKKAAFSQYPRGKVMGYSMRTDRYRYTEWQSPEGSVVARELYDHEVDPWESENLADRPELQSLVRQLSEQLRAGWEAAIPDSLFK